MRRVGSKNKGVVKGAPSGFLISLIFHAAAFMLAGMFVVFSVIKKEEKKFVPPKPIERPKMKLKKPKVKVKKSVKPKPTNRIVTKVKRASMPDIQLPEMSGIGAGLGEGIGGFEMMPNLEELSQFGATDSIGSDLKGTYYDFNRLRSGAPCVTSPDSLAALINKFLTRGWSPRVFNQYYRAPRNLYATSIAIPPLASEIGPEAFGEPHGKGWCWLVHYKGQLVYNEDITFRFWAQGDDIVAVRVNGEIKIIACYPEWVTQFMDQTSHLWHSTSADDRKYPLGNHNSVVGDWITLKAGEPQDLEILIGESVGGILTAMLMVEVEGVEYERNPHRNGPTLPFFKTAEFSRDMAEVIYSQLQPGEGTCEMGPVFNDYGTSSVTSINKIVYADPVDPPLPVTLASLTPELRTWTRGDHQSFEAKYKTRMGSSVVLQSPKGKQLKMPIKDLSPDDQTYISLLNPPTFKIELSKTSNQRPAYEVTPWHDTDGRQLEIVDYQFGVRIKPSSANAGYPYPLTVEYFVYGDEAGGSNYKLLDRKAETFTPSVENDGKLEFFGDKEVALKLEEMYRNGGGLRGMKYGGYLVTITDELGRIIQYKATHEFLYENLENLKLVPTGKHFNKNCNRCMPAVPQEKDRCPWM